MALFTDPITCQQLFNRKQVSLLWSKKEKLDPGTIAIIDVMYKGRNKGTLDGSTNVIYKLPSSIPGKLGYGRLYGSRGSLETLETDCRGTICGEFYYDIDIDNAHPRFLYQYAKRYYNIDMPVVEDYVKNRKQYLEQISDNKDVGKQAIIQIMYGGANKFSFLDDFALEIETITNTIWENKIHAKLRKYCETQQNSKGCFLSFILQTEERKNMLAIRNFFKHNGWSVDVLTYDGVMIRKSNTLNFSESTLRLCEAFVKAETEYDLIITNKLFTTIEFTQQDVEALGQIPIDRNPLYSMGTIVDDTLAAKTFATIHEKNLILDNGVMWIFNEQNGMWSDKENDFNRVITACGWKLVFYVETAIGVTTYNYSGSVKNTKQLMGKLPHVLTPKDGYFNQRVESDVGYLLFNDGIYNFKDKIFTKSFDRNIVFRCSIPRPFTERNETLINYINQTSFIDPFINEGDSQVLKHNMMRALIGDFKRKKMMVGLGFRNSGKGMLIQLSQTAFGSYVSTFNGDDLIAAVDGAESARKMGWIKAIAPTRFAFGSEISLGRSINGNTLKSVVSGGDCIKARALFENEQTIVNKSTIFLFAQDMPSVKPSADCVKGRINACNWSYSYVDHPSEPQHKQADVALSHKYSQPEYGEAFFWLLVDEYEAWRQTEFKEPVLPDCVLETIDEILPTIDVMELIRDGYQITLNNDDYIPTREIQDYVKEKGCLDSATSIGRAMTANKIMVTTKKINGKAITFRMGIKKKDVENIE